MMDDQTTATPCPHEDREELAVALLAGRLSPAAAREHEQHLFACPSCWSAVERALELRAALAQTEPAATVESARGRRTVRWGWSAALAAAAALALAVGVDRWQTADLPPERVLRGAETIPLRPAPAAPGTAGPTLAWPPVAGADVYVVRLFSSDGDLLLEEETVATTWSAAEEVPAARTGGGTVFVQIEALDPLRRRLAASPLERVAWGAAEAGATR